MSQPVVHWELWSEDSNRISDFYRQVFEWKINLVPELDYRFVETGGEGGINGGIMTPKRSGPWPGKLAIASRARPPAVQGFNAYSSATSSGSFTSIPSGTGSLLPDRAQSASNSASRLRSIPHRPEWP